MFLIEPAVPLTIFKGKIGLLVPIPTLPVPVILTNSVEVEDDVPA